MVQKIKRRPNDLDIIIGKNLKRIRLENNYSQQGLSNILGISYQQLQKYEKGQNRISASRIFEVSRLLNTNILEFYTII